MNDRTQNCESRGEAAPISLLAAARAAQNLSVADVARQLKLSPAQVAALEAGKFDRLPGPVFVRGFVRNYARLLRLDPDPILEGITSHAPGGEAERTVIPSQNIPFPVHAPRRAPRLRFLVLLLLAALGAYEVYWGEPATITVSKPSVPPPSAAALAEPARDVMPVAASVSNGPETPAQEAVLSAAPGVQDAPQTAEAMPEATQSMLEATKPVRQATAATPRLSATAPQASATAPQANGAIPQESEAVSAFAEKPGKSALAFAFERESWVEVRDRNDAVIFTRLNASGTEQQVSGKPPFKLVIGNASGVHLTFDERPVDLEPHTGRDDVARLTLQ